ncbi:MAG: tRNA 4-thiouridine(8) synthase ThiI [Deltaproteobacteria bacterium RIFCSPHIGHO2_12_FULL_43_9]|nr:MAG: tRNA 4-thiouridine(8) synthase ThiI [Deltaproteobacteria bacterium RIFCSPHIGHO2_12_FULL_43_9]
MEYNSILVRYDEIALKGRNRGRFEKRLAENIRAALNREFSNKFKIQCDRGRLVIKGERLNPYALKNVFGITSVSPTLKVSNLPEEITEKALEVAEGEWKNILAISANKKKFRVTAQRGFKAFPKTSMEIESAVGSMIQKRFPDLEVDLTDYDLELGIDVRPDASYIFTDRISCFRGLPVGINQRLVALISGGIDSPVAAWMLMKRGCSITFVHFHAHPYTAPAAKQKVLELVTVLKKFQNDTVIYFVPFAEIQLVINKNVPERYRTILYRRMMHRIADTIKERENAYGLITGDSIGQVSSQTVENMRSIMEAIPGPVFQPLIGMDKVEIIEKAKMIGTFDISIQDVADCCTLFTPRSPVISSTINEIQRVEENLDIPKLIDDVVNHLEKVFL